MFRQIPPIDTLALRSEVQEWRMRGVGLDTGGLLPDDLATERKFYERRSDIAIQISGSPYEPKTPTMGLDTSLSRSLWSMRG